MSLHSLPVQLVGLAELVAAASLTTSFSGDQSLLENSRREGRSGGRLFFPALITSLGRR